MNVLIIDNGTKHLGRLKELLVGNQVDVCELFSAYPAFDNYNLIILSGGSQISVSSAPEVFEWEEKLIKSSNKPIIGICQGAEIIGVTYGSKLEYLEHKAKGIKDVEFVSDFLGFKTIKVYEAHHFAIKKLGSDLEEIAHSSTGVEIFRHKTKPIFGLQFHPEMCVDQSLGDNFFRKIISLI